MKTEEILKNIRKIDKKILEIYNKIKSKETYTESFDQEIYELKNLASLEDYLYSNLNRNELKDIIEKYESLFDKNLYYELSIKQLEKVIEMKNEQNIELVEIMIRERMINYLNFLYKLDVPDSEMKDEYNDDKTKIYLPNNTIETISMTTKQYIEKAVAKEEKVYAFYEPIRRKLIFESILGKDMAEIFFLYVGLETTERPQFYAEEIYNNIFTNKLLEERMLSFDFDIDSLLENLSIQKNTPNKKFVYWYRSHKSFSYLEQMLKQFNQYKDDIILSKSCLIYNLSFDMFLLTVDANIMLLTKEDFQQLKKQTEQYLNIYKNDNYELVKRELNKKVSQENYQKLKKIINL